jgi:hypothetical protein
MAVCTTEIRLSSRPRSAHLSATTRRSLSVVPASSGRNIDPTAIRPARGTYALDASEHELMLVENWGESE